MSLKIDGENMLFAKCKKCGKDLFELDGKNIKSSGFSVKKGFGVLCRDCSEIIVDGKR